jgi:hypothetical protein
MIRILLFLSIISSCLYAQIETKGDKYISLHVGEPVYISFSMDLFRQHGIKLITGLGTPDLIGYQDYSKKYIDKKNYLYYSRNMILLNNTYFQYPILSFLHNRFQVYLNAGLQTRIIPRFSYYRNIPANSTKVYTMNIPSKALVELLPIIQLGISSQSPNRKFLYGLNVGMAKTVFPIVWRLEPMADVYFGINLRKTRNRNT